MKLNFWIILGLVSLSFQCRCPRGKQAIPEGFAIEPVAKFEEKKVKIGGKSYGYPKVYQDVVYLRETFSVSFNKSNNYSLIDPCPENYRLLSESEMESLIKENLTDLMDKNGLKLKNTTYYISSSKYSGTKDVTSPYFYMFYGIYINQTAVVKEFNYTEQKKNTKALCRREKGLNKKVTLKLPETFPKGEKVTFSVEGETISGILWKIGTNLYKGSEFKESFSETGCKIIELWVSEENGNTSYLCEKFGVDQRPNSKKTSFSLKKVKMINTTIPINYISDIFFSPSNGPVSPKPEGGFYVFLSSKEDSNLHILEYDRKFNLIQKKNLEIQGYPLDICATPWGFAILYCTKDYSGEFFSGYYSDFTKRFELTLFNKHKSVPYSVKEQVNLTLSASQSFGLGLIYSPENGKIIYAKGTFGVVFAHYNNFGAETPNPEGHTGDTFFTVDENGNSHELVFGWGSSHSLIQSNTFDGTYIINAALGDYYPKNIKINVIDPLSGTVIDSKEDIVPRGIPGNGKGNSGGRFGGIFYDGGKYAAIYSVKPIKDALNPTNALGMIIFELNKGKISNKKNIQFEGIDARNIVNIRAGKYGKNILITYIHSIDKDYGEDYCPYYWIGNDYLMFYMLVDFDGKILFGPSITQDYAMNLNDEMRQLEDGGLIWTTVEKGFLKIAYVS